MNRVFGLFWIVLLIADIFIAAACALNLLFTWIRETHPETAPHESTWRIIKIFKSFWRIWKTRDISFLILCLMSLGTAVEGLVWLIGLSDLSDPALSRADEEWLAALRDFGQTQGIARLCAAIPRYLWAAHLFQDFRIRRQRKG